MEKIKKKLACNPTTFFNVTFVHLNSKSSSWGNLSLLFSRLIGHLWSPASRRSLLDTLQISNIFKCKCLRGEGEKKEYKSTNRAELSSHQFSRLFSLPEQKRCITRSSGLNAAAENLNNCSIMRQIHLDSSWWRTGSLIGGMQLSETFLSLMIYLQAAWAFVGKYCIFLLYICGQ